MNPTETWTAYQNPEDIGSNYWRIRVADGLKDSLHGYCGERRARLIAAAPDLLEALKALTSNPHVDLGGLVYKVRDSEGEGWDGPQVKHWSDAVQAARAAIAKAEGKA